MKNIFFDAREWLRKNKLSLARWLWFILVILVVIDGFYFLFLCPQSSKLFFAGQMFAWLTVLDITIGITLIISDDRKYRFFLGIIPAKLPRDWENIKIF